MVTLTSEDTSQMETSQKTSAKKTRVFKRLGKFLVRLSKNKGSKSDDFAFNSIHRQYYSNTLKQYSSLSKEPSTSATCSRRSSQISKISDQNGPNLDTLPECILLHLFSYLNVQDVTSLGWCAPNLYSAAYREKKLWQNVDHVCDGCSPHHDHLQPFLNDCTTTLRLTNSTSSDLVQNEHACLGPSFFNNLKNLTNLTSFTLENHCLGNRNRLNLRCLPESLTELRLRRINLLDQNGAPCRAFHNVHLNLPNLEKVDISHCSWVTSKVLYSLSHCSHLTKLVMVGCTGIDYADLTLQAATIYGFWKLESLDLRLTNVTFEEVSIFKKLTRLREILLEKPDYKIGKITKQESKSKKKRRSSGCSWTKSAENMYYSDSSDQINLSDYVSSRLETLVVRNYVEITDFVVDEIRMYFGSLKYLDITDTHCSLEKIIELQNQRPNLRLLY